MGELVAPILNSGVLARIGNSDLSVTSKAIEQLLKTLSSPADLAASLNDLVKDGLGLDTLSGLISAAKTLEAFAGFFVKLVPDIGIGLSIANLGVGLAKARDELLDPAKGQVSATTRLGITADFLSIIGGAVLAAGAVGAAGTVGLVLIPVGAALTIAGVLADRGDPDFIRFIEYFNSLPFVPDWNNALRAVFLSHDFQYSAQSVAIAQALLKIDPTLDRATLNRILDDSASSRDVAVEAVAAFNQLRALFNPNATPLASDVSGADFATAVAAFTPPSAGSVVALGGQSREFIATQARYNFSYFVALNQLSAFAVVDTTGSAIRTAQQTAYATDYPRWLQDSQLTDDQLAQGMGNYGKLWYDDRAAMLTWKLKGQTDESAVVGGVQTVRGTIAGVGPESLFFSDLATQSGVLVDSVATVATRRFVFGSANADTIEGDQKDDHLYGGGGKDTITAGKGDDYVEGNAGNDIIDGGEGNDRLIGGTGNDQLTGGKDSDILIGGADNDELTAGEGNDVLYGGAGNDTLDGGDGNDFLSGGAGIDTLSGGENNDYLVDQGGSDKTTLKGDGGNDILEVKGGSGITVLSGGAGNDILTGASGINTLDGGEGNDVITGGDDLDIIKGGEGADAIEAGGGADLITGGAGADYMKGGAGDDAYIYDSADFGTDLIEDGTGTLVGKTGGAYDVNSLAYVGGGYEYRKYTMGSMTLLGINLLGDGKNTVRGYYRTRSCSRNILKGCRAKRHLKLLETACKAIRHHCTA